MTHETHEELLEHIGSLRDWKSPDGVLQVKDLKWFKDLNQTSGRDPETEAGGSDSERDVTAESSKPKAKGGSE